MSAKGRDEPDPAVRFAAAAADELYEVRDTFFPADVREKEKRLQSLADDALRVLNATPAGVPVAMNSPRSACEVVLSLPSVTSRGMPSKTISRIRKSTNPVCHQSKKKKTSNTRGVLPVAEVQNVVPIMSQCSVFSSSENLESIQISNEDAGVAVWKASIPQRPKTRSRTKIALGVGSNSPTIASLTKGDMLLLTKEGKGDCVKPIKGDVAAEGEHSVVCAKKQENNNVSLDNCLTSPNHKMKHKELVGTLPSDLGDVMYQWYPDFLKGCCLPPNTPRENLLPPGNAFCDSAGKWRLYLYMQLKKLQCPKAAQAMEQALTIEDVCYAVEMAGRQLGRDPWTLIPEPRTSFPSIRVPEISSFFFYSSQLSGLAKSNLNLHDPEKAIVPECHLSDQSSSFLPKSTLAAKVATVPAPDTSPSREQPAGLSFGGSAKGAKSVADSSTINQGLCHTFETSLLTAAKSSTGSQESSAIRNLTTLSKCASDKTGSLLLNIEWPKAQPRRLIPASGMSAGMFESMRGLLNQDPLPTFDDAREDLHSLTECYHNFCLPAEPWMAELTSTWCELVRLHQVEAEKRRWDSDVLPQIKSLEKRAQWLEEEADEVSRQVVEYKVLGEGVSKQITNQVLQMAKLYKEFDELSESLACNKYFESVWAAELENLIQHRDDLNHQVSTTNDQAAQLRRSRPSS